MIGFRSGYSGRKPTTKTSVPNFIPHHSTHYYLYYFYLSLERETLCSLHIYRVGQESSVSPETGMKAHVEEEIDDK